MVELQSAQYGVETRAPAKSRQSLILHASRATALGALKENDNWKKRRSPISTERRRPTKNNVQTSPWECSSNSEATRFILPSIPDPGNRPSPAHPLDILFSFHFGFSGSPVAREDLRWRRATRGGPGTLRPGIEAL
jgi:hypothetical protein